MATGVCDPVAVRPGGRTAAMRAFGVPALVMLGGCVQVTAPERPIEINLNVNVRQEVLLRLERDAEQIIDENPDLFPQEQP